MYNIRVINFFGIVSSQHDLVMVLHFIKGADFIKIVPKRVNLPIFRHKLYKFVKHELKGVQYKKLLALEDV